MPNQTKRYALLYIPDSGLFYGERGLMDGTGTQIHWDGTLPLHIRREDAVAAKGRILSKYPAEYAAGEIVVLPVEPIEKTMKQEDGPDGISNT